MASGKRRLHSQAKSLLAKLRGEWLVILDFDRTLFDTAWFYQDLSLMIEQTWGAQTARQMREFEKTSEHLDPFQYLRDEHGISYDAVVEAFEEFRSAKYPEGNSYLYPDVPGLLSYLNRRPRTHVRIVTTGTLQSQRFKLALCPELGGVPHEIISGNKGELLQARFNKAGAITLGGRHYQHLFIVDDKDTSLTPIKPHKRRLLVHLLRPEAKFTDHTGRPDVREIESLDEIRGNLL